MRGIAGAWAARAAAAILVLSIASLSASAASFLDGYKVTQGDFDADGMTDDLFVSPGRQVIIIPGDIDIPIAVQPVRDFVLQYNGNGTFSVVSQLTPTQRTDMAQWPAAAVDGWLRDVDYDGDVDLELTGVDAAVAGAFDQIIFAPDGGVGDPDGITAENLRFGHYHEQVFGWMRNPNYFEDNAPLKITSVEPPTRYWFASVRDPNNVFLINQWLSDCRAFYPGYDCAVSTRPPPPPCVRTTNVYDDSGVLVGTDVSNICQILTQIIIYFPGAITVAKDYSVYDPDAQETTEILERLNANCPVIPVTDEDRLRAIEEQIWQHVFVRGSGVDTPNSFSHTPFPGDQLFNTNDKTYHHYDVYTRVCEGTEANCDVAHVRDIALRYFSVPNMRLAPLFTPIPGPPVMAYMSFPGALGFSFTYTRPAGLITQQFVQSGRWTGAIQNITEVDHLVYPGTISRYIDTNLDDSRRPDTPPLGGDTLYIFTHGVGINRMNCNFSPGSRPFQMVLGFSNDMFGEKAFKQLDKEMIRWWRQNYHPNGAGNPPTPSGQSNPRGASSIE